MKLTDSAIRSAKPGLKPIRLFDGQGLYLEVMPKGQKHWRLKFRFNGKESRITLGMYPDVPLAGRVDKLTGEYLDGARERCAKAKKQLALGKHPSGQRAESLSTVQAQATADPNAPTFEQASRAWFSKHSPHLAANHSGRLMSRFERDIFPVIGQVPVATLKPTELLGAVRPIEERGAVESAHRALNTCGQVLRFCVANGWAERDFSSELRNALSPVKTTHFAAVTSPNEIGPLLRKLWGYQGTYTVCCALKLAPLLFVRPGELRQALWEDIEFDRREWRFLTSKTNVEHIVPLSDQALEILRSLRPLTQSSRFVFPSPRSNEKPLSDNALLAALRTMGIAQHEMSIHGFRAMARTVLDEELHFRPDLIEHQLAHAVRDPNGRAYNRTKFLPERHAMMQAWSDYLECLRAPTESEFASERVIAQAR
jgi:integrase